MKAFQLMTLSMGALCWFACSATQGNDPPLTGDGGAGSDTGGGTGTVGGTGGAPAGGSGGSATACEPGAVQACTGTDGCTSQHSCYSDGSGWEPCPCSPAAGGTSSGGTSSGGTTSGGTTSGGTTSGGTTSGGTSSGGTTGACTVAAQTSPSISDFEAGTPTLVEVDGRQGLWVTTPEGSATTTVENGALHAVTTGGSWASVSTVIANGACYDASAYTGISFQISSPTNNSLLFVVPTGDTTGDSSHFRAPVTVSAGVTTVQVAFSSLVAPTWGAGAALPAGYDAPSQMTGIGFGVEAESELMDLTIDNVAFY